MQVTKVSDNVYTYKANSLINDRGEYLDASVGTFTRCTVEEAAQVEDQETVYIRARKTGLFIGIDDIKHLCVMPHDMQEEFMDIVENNNEDINERTWEYFCKKYNTDSTSIDKAFITTLKNYLDRIDDIKDGDAKKMLILIMFDFILDNKQELFKAPKLSLTLFNKANGGLWREEKQDADWDAKLRSTTNKIYADFISHTASSVLRSPPKKYDTYEIDNLSKYGITE